MFKHLTLALSCCLGCATARPETTLQATATPPTPPLAAPAHDAHDLVVAALACWSGGLWSDARSVPEIDRDTEAHRRCHELVREVNGSDDLAQYERLRAIDAQEVAAIRDRVAALAAAEGGNADELVKLMTAIADVERETMYARRAGDKVKKDIDVPARTDKRHADEVSSDPQLSQSRAFEALAALQVGRYTHEARAVLYINALDRAELARGLPKHLKLDVVAKPYAMLFGVKPPASSDDPSSQLEPGSWLTYLSDVATAAGHAVPAEAQSLRDRELMAWSGVAMGLADRLQVEAQNMSDTELRAVAETVVRRLDIAYHADQAGVEQSAHASK